MVDQERKELNVFVQYVFGRSSKEFSVAAFEDDYNRFLSDWGCSVKSGGGVCSLEDCWGFRHSFLSNTIVSVYCKSLD